MVNGDQLRKDTNTPDNPQLSKQGLLIQQRVPFGGCPQSPRRLGDSTSEKVPGQAKWCWRPTPMLSHVPRHT